MFKNSMPQKIMPPQIISANLFNGVIRRAIMGAFLVLGSGFIPAQAETSIPTVAEYVMVTEFETGRVLMEKGKDIPMKPALSLIHI